MHNQEEHLLELENGYNDPGRGSLVDDQLSMVTAKIEAFQASMVDDHTLPNVQSELMDLARRSGCQLRKAAIQAGSTDAWHSRESLEASEEGVEYDEDKTKYSLRTEQIILNFTGSLEQTSSFLKDVMKKPWLMRIVQVNFTHTPDDDGRLAVEANLAFFKLTRDVEQDGMLVQWRDGARQESVH